MRLTASLPILTLLKALVTLGLSCAQKRSRRGTSVEDRLVYVPGHPLISLEDLGDELALAVARHRKALDFARGRNKVTRM